MTDRKFIELLNLYLDHELSQEDAARLETEIQRDPARRRVYRQYCQMQKACALLAEDFRTEVPEKGKVTPFPADARRSATLRVVYACGAVAAAACIAFLLVGRQAGTSNEAPVASTAAPAATLAQAQPAAARPLLAMPAATRTHSELQTVFTTQPLAPLGTLPVTDSLAAEASRLRYEWIKQVHLNSLNLDSATFETTPTVEPDSRTFANKRPFDAQVEMSAYRFQR